MSYKATVYNVLIASPEDVEAERRIVRQKVHRWNELHSAATSTVLQPIGWETHAVPELGDRPQAIINKRLVEHCDMLIGVFWTRLGTPTGKADSGTVEEIEEFIDANKPALIYFSREPFAEGSVDTNQFAALSEFRTSLKSRGLISEYGSKSEFEGLLSGHLAQAVHLHFTPSIEEATDYNKRSVTQSFAESKISPSAQKLLSAIAEDPSGTMLNIHTKDGLQIQANRTVLNTPLDPRSEAKWSEARDELERAGYIEPAGYKREIFRITHSGFKANDHMSV